MFFLFFQTFNWYKIDTARVDPLPENCVGGIKVIWLLWTRQVDNGIKVFSLVKLEWNFVRWILVEILHSEMNEDPTTVNNELSLKHWSSYANKIAVNLLMSEQI